MSGQSEPIFLNPHSYVAERERRLVYFHPDNNDFLVKISKLTLEQYQNNQKISYRNYYRYLKCLTREVAEYARSRLCSSPYTRIIQQIIGFVDTNLGIGLIVKTEKDEKGALAPTLKCIIEDNLLHGVVREYFELFCCD